MGHSNDSKSVSYVTNPKSVPYVDSEKLEKFLQDNGFVKDTGFDKKIFDENFTNNFTGKHEDVPSNSLNNGTTSDQPKKESIGKSIFKFIDDCCMKNPGPILAIILGGSMFICYKMTVSILSQAVFKGNLKTSRYFDKHAS